MDVLNIEVVRIAASAAATVRDLRVVRGMAPPGVTGCVGGRAPVETTAGEQSTSRA
jgi:hypothetical protein